MFFGKISRYFNIVLTWTYITYLNNKKKSFVIYPIEKIFDYQIIHRYRTGWSKYVIIVIEVDNKY